MSTYKTIRGKTVKLGKITLRGGLDGSLTIDVLGEAMTLAENDASLVHDLMGDVLEWESQKTTSENAMDRAGDQAEAQSGKLDDERANDGR